MGACCGKADEEGLTPLTPGSYLYAAQLMSKTKNGKPVNMKVMKRAMTDADLNKSRADPGLPNDMRTIFNPPFSVLNKLTNYVYLSGIAGLTKENLEKMQINLIINATYEWPKLQPIINGKEVVCYRVPVDDSGQDDISIYFDEVNAKIEENANKGGHTLVHCMAGASRSTTLVLAYLMRFENISLFNAFKSVKKRREIGRPNLGFWEQLIKYEIRSRGKTSVKMEKFKDEGFEVIVPDFYKTTFQDLYSWEARKQIEEAKEKQKNPGIKTKGEKVYNPDTKTYE